jgi:hypothetical protein
MGQCQAPLYQVTVQVLRHTPLLLHLRFIHVRARPLLLQPNFLLPPPLTPATPPQRPLPLLRARLNIHSHELCWHLVQTERRDAQAYRLKVAQTDDAWLLSTWVLKTEEGTVVSARTPAIIPRRPVLLRAAYVPDAASRHS